MAVVFENTDAYKGRVFCFHEEPAKRDVMGYTLTGVAEGDVVPQGTALVVNDNDTNGKKTAVICKYAHITKKISTTKFELDYIGFLKVGDKIFKSGQDSPTLSTISNINGKEITLAVANSQLAAGDTVVEGKSVTTGEGQDAVTTIEPVSIPNRIAARTQKMTAVDKTISATHNVLAIKNVLDYPVEWLNETTFPGSCLLKGCPLILFINQ